MDVLTHIKNETRDPSGRDLPIYVDPIGLLEADKTMQSPVRFAVQNAPLRTTLDLILRQLGMVYEVRGGLIHISSTGLQRLRPGAGLRRPILAHRSMRARRARGVSRRRRSSDRLRLEALTRVHENRSFGEIFGTSFHRGCSSANGWAGASRLWVAGVGTPTPVFSRLAGRWP